MLDGLSGGADTNESNAATSIVFNAARFAPVRQLSEDTDNTEDAVSTRRSPLERLLATWKKRRRLQQNYNVGLNWKPFKGFTFRSEFGYRWDYDDTEQAWAPTPPPTHAGPAWDSRSTPTTTTPAAPGATPTP